MSEPDKEGLYLVVNRHNGYQLAWWDNKLKVFRPDASSCAELLGVTSWISTEHGLIDNYKTATELLLEIFRQDCYDREGYDHRCISAYERVQEFLINIKVIDEKECWRK